MTTNERLINNYIYQIRESFSIQQVMEHTGVPKTSCHRIIKNWEKEGKIKRVSVSSHPVLYRYNYQTTSVRLGCEGSRYAEVESKAKELGVSARTVYRREKREDELQEDPNRIYRKHLVKVVSMLSLKKQITVSEVTDAVGGNLDKANDIITDLENMGYLRRDGDMYNFIENRRIS